MGVLAAAPPAIREEFQKISRTRKKPTRRKKRKRKVIRRTQPRQPRDINGNQNGGNILGIPDL